MRYILFIPILYLFFHFLSLRIFGIFFSFGHFLFPCKNFSDNCTFMNYFLTIYIPLILSSVILIGVLLYYKKIVDFIIIYKIGFLGFLLLLVSLKGSIMFYDIYYYHTPRLNEISIHEPIIIKIYIGNNDKNGKYYYYNINTNTVSEIKNQNNISNSENILSKKIQNKGFRFNHNNGTLYLNRKSVFKCNVGYLCRYITSKDNKYIIFIDKKVKRNIVFNKTLADNYVKVFDVDSLLFKEINFISTNNEFHYLSNFGKIKK